LEEMEGGLREVFKANIDKNRKVYMYLEIVFLLCLQVKMWEMKGKSENAEDRREVVGGG
jgi:hypothetical protein